MRQVDEWLRRRIKAIYWEHRKKVKTRYRMIRQYKLPEWKVDGLANIVLKFIYKLFIMMPREVVIMDISVLESLCYKTGLGSRLSRSLSHFDKDILMNDIQQAVFFFNERLQLVESFSRNYRIKSMQSVRVKYERYDQHIAVERVYNDLLGFRLLCDDYNDLDLSAKCIKRISDMRNGKRIDDGYRGIHVYVQPTHEYYPIEIQFNTHKDRKFADWTHIYLYKQASAEVGKKLRMFYDEGIIKTEDDFRREWEKCVI